ncbi:MAG: GTPase, partial [Planctomycetes bacterium]|nr:GTPase [Planctomycetota bacterium]
DIQTVRRNIERVNPEAYVIDATLQITVEDPEDIKGRRVLAIEDGPTVTHGGMPYGAAVIAAKRCGALEIVDPRPYAAGTIKDTYRQYPDIGTLLPAMGYGQRQILELESTINNTDCEVVVSGTPIDIGRRMNINKPVVRAKYEFQELGGPGLDEIIKRAINT